MKEIDKKNRQINILGKTFKPETNLLLGSPSILLKNLIEEKKYKVYAWDPYVDEPYETITNEMNWNDSKIKHTFFIGTKHPDFTKFKLTPKSVNL